MRIPFFSVLLMTLVFSLTLIACHYTEKAAPAASVREQADSAALVKRGEYLVTIIGCDDCHSPKRMGAQGPELIPELRLSGYPSSRPQAAANAQEIKKGWIQLGGDLTSAAGPWGTSFAANITGDETGIGNWTEQQFITALRKGKYKGIETGRNLLPPMPVISFSKMTDDDLRSIYHYLKTVPAVKNIPPSPLPPAF